MADVHDPEVRSYNMSQIKGKNTKPEMLVRRYLYQNGYRYRLHVKDIPGKPDIVIRKLKTVIFINGCFWHGHKNCRYFVLPKTRTDWWAKKISKTQSRDQQNISDLKIAGWKIIVIWECDLKNQNLENTLMQLLKDLQN